MKKWWQIILSIPLSLIISNSALAASPRNPDKIVECDILVVGGGLAGSATAYEALLAGKTVCLTEITDWVGGQISAQGTSALDEKTTQANLLFYPRGYLELREKIAQHYGKLNPGDCWVSESCFLPQDGHKILFKQLEAAAKKGKGVLHWFPSTIIKELEITAGQIKKAIAIQHHPVSGTNLHSQTLSQNIKDIYQYENSSNFEKTIIELVPKTTQKPADWYIIEATETGEIIALADVPYRLGIDPRSYLEPTSSSATADPYCTQGFTYTFAIEATAEPQTYQLPDFYLQYAPYYSYELERFTNLDLLFTYRRIWSPKTGETQKVGGITFTTPTPGDISMQNWTWGNDYRPGSEQNNLIYTREQLQATGQLTPGGWLGGLRTETLRKGEEHALGFFYWLVLGRSDSRLGAGVKQPHPYYQLLTGEQSPMGTEHGLSKYPYIREGRRIIGRPYPGYAQGFTISEIDISRRNYHDEYYRQTLSPHTYRQLLAALAGLETFSVLKGEVNLEEVKQRTRSTIYPDSVGIGHYALDFHPCMEKSPPETPENTERAGERRAGGQAYPFQIPLRAIIPQKIDNLLVAGKSIATSHIASAAYRVHSFEWSSGAAAGITAVFALEKGILPYQLVDGILFREEKLQELRQRLDESGNPTAFPDTSIFNNNWDNWLK